MAEIDGIARKAQHNRFRGYNKNKSDQICQILPQDRCLIMLTCLIRHLTGYGVSKKLFSGMSQRSMRFPFLFEPICLKKYGRRGPKFYLGQIG